MIYFPIQLPQEIDEKKILQAIQAIGKGMDDQHRSIILATPEIFGIKAATGGQWRYLRIKVRLLAGTNKNHRRDIHTKSGPGTQKILCGLCLLDDYVGLQR